MCSRNLLLVMLILLCLPLARHADHAHPSSLRAASASTSPSRSCWAAEVFNCYLIVTAIQMGANIDRVVISSRFNELRRKERRLEGGHDRGAELRLPDDHHLRHDHGRGGPGDRTARLRGGRHQHRPLSAAPARLSRSCSSAVTARLLLFGERFAQVTSFRAERLPEKPLRRFACLALALASLAAIVLGPVGLRSVAIDEAQQRERFTPR